VKPAVIIVISVVCSVVAVIAVQSLSGINFSETPIIETSIIHKDEEPTHKKLSANLVKSVENLCYGIAPAENIGVCTSMDFIFTGFVSIFPPLESDNRFDVQYCKKVDTNLYLLDKLMYRDNYQEEGFFDLADEELRKKVTITLLEKNQMSMSYYDVTYDFIESVDEFLLFWNDAYNASC